jgi:hypothetical protein
VQGEKDFLEISDFSKIPRGEENFVGPKMCVEGASHELYSQLEVDI